jgi:Neuraminidase (sialidase)
MIVLSSGRVLLPLHHKEVVRPEKISTQVAYSDDDGRTWQLSPQRLWTDDMLPAYRAKMAGRSGFWEASIAQRSDGSLFMIGRTYAGWLYSTESRDDGIHWSALRPTSLPSSPAPGRVERIPGSSDLVVIWNSCCVNPTGNINTQRVTLSAAVSSDGGKTWQTPRTIEAVNPGARVEYPAISFYDDVAYVTYRVQSGTNARSFRMQEYLAVLPVSWFYAEHERTHR